jgi:hypothetical protein
MKKRVDETWDWCRSHAQLVVVIVAAPFLILALILIVADRIAGATLSAAIFMIVVLLPSVESIEAFGLIKAQVRKATELLQKISAAGRATANLTYAQLGEGSRMHGISTKEKQKLADAADKMMVDAGATQEEISSVKFYYIQYALYDLYQRFEALFIDYSNTLNQKNLKKLSKIPPERQNSPEAEALRDTTGRLSQNLRPNSILADLTQIGFRALCERNIRDDVIPGDDAKKLREYADRLSKIAADVEMQGRVTDAAAELIDAHSQQDRKALYRSVFGEADRI